MAITKAIKEAIEVIRAKRADFQEIYPEVDWKHIIDFRHFLAHEYQHIDIATLRDILDNDLPDLYKWAGSRVNREVTNHFVQ